VKKLKSILVAALLALVGVSVHADTTTTRWGITKPDVGSTNWGPKINTNYDTIDNAAGLALVNAFTNTNSFAAVTTFTAQLQAAAGSAAAPSYSATAQTNKGMWFDTNIVGFSVAGSTMEYMTSTAVVIPSNSALTLSSGTASNFTLSNSSAAGLSLLGFKGTNVSSGTAAADIARFSQVKILQVVNTTVSASSSTSATSYVATALSASITPQGTSSRILVLINGELQVNNASAFGHVTIWRNGTNVAGNDGLCAIGAGASTDSAIQTCSIAYLDSPASSSSVTYKAAMKTQSGSATVGFPGGSVGTDVASLTLVEVNGL
jgi:hypothetical protein